MNKVKKELKRIVEQFPDDCSWDDVIFALHMKKIMAPGYKSKNDSMILPTREIVDSWTKEVERRMKDADNGKEKWIPYEEVMEQLRNRKRKKLKRLPGFPRKSAKEAAMETAAHLPDHADWDELAHRLSIRKKIEDGLRDIRQGNEFDHEEVFKEFGIPVGF